MSAAAVIPTPRVVGMFTGLEASVACLISSLLNPMSQALGGREYCETGEWKKPAVLFGKE